MLQHLNPETKTIAMQTPLLGPRWRRLAKQLVARHGRETALAALALRLKDKLWSFHGGRFNNPEEDPVVGRLLRIGFRRVDWTAIAETLLEGDQ